MTIKQAKSSFQIIAGKIVFTVDDFMKKLGEFALNFEGQWGEAYFEIVDSVQYFQHKYYRGYLLPEVAYLYSETEDYTHNWILKPEFLFFSLPDGDVKKIPNKHLKNCRIITRMEKENHGPDAKEIEVVKGYIPSTAVLTFDEMKDYIIKVENRLISDQQGRLGAVKNEKEANHYRGLANMTEIIGARQESLFEVAN
jgi:hypothetical protein